MNTRNNRGLTRRSTTEGFTLVETLIYLALYTIIMTGALVSMYSIFGSAARNESKALMQEEGSYLVGKIDWALTGAQTISSPASNLSGNTLQVTKYDASAGNPFIVSLSGGNVTMQRGANPSQVLNNSNVTITCAPAGCFTHTAASGDGINPEGLKASFTVHATTSEGLSFSQDFTTVKYLRK